MNFIEVPEHYMTMFLNKIKEQQQHSLVITPEVEQQLRSFIQTSFQMEQVLLIKKGLEEKEKILKDAMNTAP